MGCVIEVRPGLPVDQVFIRLGRSLGHTKASSQVGYWATIYDLVAVHLWVGVDHPRIW